MDKKHTVKTIIFDLGGVLIAKPTNQYEHYLEVLNASKEQFFEAFAFFQEAWQTGVLDEKDFWVKISRKLGKNVPEGENSIWLEGFLKAYKEDEAVFNLLKSLRKKSYEIVLFSNTEPPIQDYVSVHENYLDNFDRLYFSCGMGFAKPDVMSYNMVLAEINKEPGETIFIDDKPINIDGANKLGMKGILYTDLKSLEDKLKEFGVTVN